MYRTDQGPSWTAALNPVNYFWNKEPSVSEPSQQATLSAVHFRPVPTSQGRPLGSSNAWPDCTQARDSVQTQAQAQAQTAAQLDQMWDPIPLAAPDGFRDEVLNELYAIECTEADTEPAKQEYTQSGPTDSGFTAGTDKACSKQRDLSALSRTRSQPNTSEQKQANARESQKRFRMRQKARSQAIEAQLASTEAELCNLKMRQQQLESRNLLLEKRSDLSNKHKEEQLSGDGPFERLYIAHETDASENGPSITISVHGSRHSMTVQEIAVMPVTEFACLWTEYIRQIGACLIQLEQKQDQTVQQMMEKLTVESSCLTGCIKLLNHDVHRAMIDGKLDPGLAHTHKLGAAFYTNLTRLLAISEEQMQDIMLLRRIYVTRRGLHALERRALVSQAPISHHQIPLPSDNLTQLSDLASQLKKNAADDYRVYHRVACASRRGIYTTKQWAIMIVQSYPYMPILETHFETMAADRGEPSRADLLASAHNNHMAAEWRHLNKYLEIIASTKSHDYIPLTEKLVKSVCPTSGASMPFGPGAAMNLQYLVA